MRKLFCLLLASIFCGTVGYAVDEEIIEVTYKKDLVTATFENASLLSVVKALNYESGTKIREMQVSVVISSNVPPETALELGGRFHAKGLEYFKEASIPLLKLSNMPYGEALRWAADLTECEIEVEDQDCTLRVAQYVVDVSGMRFPKEFPRSLLADRKNVVNGRQYFVGTREQVIDVLKAAGENLEDHFPRVHLEVERRRREYEKKWDMLKPS